MGEQAYCLLATSAYDLCDQFCKRKVIEIALNSAKCENIYQTLRKIQDNNIFNSIFRFKFLVSLGRPNGFITSFLLLAFIDYCKLSTEVASVH
jgi:hypothetical protein